MMTSEMEQNRKEQEQGINSTMGKDHDDDSIQWSDDDDPVWSALTLESHGGW